MNNISQKEDTLKKRFFFKLSSNIIGLPISILTESIITRGLGAKLYGDFTFLSSYFNNIVGFFDASTSIAFYTKLSQRQKEYGLIKFYWRFVSLVVILVSILTALVIAFDGTDRILPNQEYKYIFMASFWALLMWISQVIRKVIDAFALTTQGELVLIATKMSGIFLLSGIYFLGKLSLIAFFLYHYLLFFLLFIGWGYVLKKNNFKLFPKNELTFKSVQKYIYEFYTYSGPLFFGGVIGISAGIFDRWCLQKFSGSIEQGYFGLSIKIATICFLFTGAMTTLLTREFAVSISKNELTKAKTLFSRYVPMFCAITIFFSVFLSLQGNKVAILIGGISFKNAGLSIGLFSLYPIHQTYGQLSASVFYASGRTKIIRNISVIFRLLFLPLTYLLIAPKDYYGFDLGALGLAISMVAHQYVAVNVQLWYNCKYLDMNFHKYFYHQIYSFMLIGILAYGSITITDIYLSNYIISFLVSGVIYSACILGLLFALPEVFSLNKIELNYYSSKVIKYVKSL